MSSNPATWKEMSVHAAVAAVFAIEGLFIAISGKLVIIGRFIGEIEEVSFPFNLLVAASSFLFSAFLIVSLRPSKLSKNICISLLILAIANLVIGYSFG